MSDVAHQETTSGRGVDRMREAPGSILLIKQRPLHNDQWEDCLVYFIRICNTPTVGLETIGSCDGTLTLTNLGDCKTIYWLRQYRILSNGVQMG